LNVLQRVFIEHHKISQFAWFQVAQILGEAYRFSSIDGARTQLLKIAHAS